jgi:hypothetical protein
MNCARRKEILISVIAALNFAFLLGSADLAQGRKTAGQTLHASGRQKEILNKINFISVYTVVNGQSRIVNFRQRDLYSGKPLEIKGYVTGVVVLCNDQVKAQLNNTPMSKILREKDGTLICRYFGPLKSRGLLSPYLHSISSKTTTGNVNNEKCAPNFLPGGYSYFPKVLGDGVCSEDHFAIVVKKGANSLEIPVRQQSSKRIATLWGNRKSISFHFQGNSADLTPIIDLNDRLQTIAQGIWSAENKFNLDLTTRIHLIDYNKICNAITCEGTKDIWFYIKTLREEPLRELKVIAEHESMHLLVNLLGLTDNTELLIHFADLKGYDIFSRERFLLMTRGLILSEEYENTKENAIFFAFIDERNFLRGMKGGHSHQNPDEFCASFIHSLMYAERLGSNLDRPLILHDRCQPHFLTQEEKMAVLRKYIKTLDILSHAVAIRPHSSSGAVNLRNILQQIHTKAIHEQVRRTTRLSPENARVGVSPACCALMNNN